MTRCRCGKQMLPALVLPDGTLIVECRHCDRGCIRAACSHCSAYREAVR